MKLAKSSIRSVIPCSMHHSSFVLRILVLALLVCASPRSPKVTEEGSALELRCRHTLQVRA